MEPIEQTVGVAWWPGLLAGAWLVFVLGRQQRWALAAQGLSWTLLLTLLPQGLFVQLVPLSTLLIADASARLGLTYWELTCLPLLLAVGWWLSHRLPRRSA